MSSTLELVKHQQRQWALTAGHNVDPKGYLPTVEANLFQPLSKDTYAEFEQAKGSELLPKEGSNPKMCALHSSSALVCNVFDYWRKVDTSVIGRALGMEQPITEVEFEAQLSSGMRGTKPTLDLLLTGSGSAAWGVESKFTEPFNHSRTGPPFRESYFQPEKGRWTVLDLPGCQKLAEDLRDGVESFMYLDAPQLLKHTLGLQNPERGDHPREAHLILLWYRVDAEESDALAAEIDHFGERVDESLGFRAVTYQEVFAHIASETQGHAAHSPYLEYLRTRYFSE